MGGEVTGQGAGDRARSLTADAVSSPRRAAIGLVFLLLLWAVGEATAFLGLRALESMGKQAYAPTLEDDVSDAHRDILERVIDGKAEYVGFSRELGWTTVPYGRNGLYQANSQGVRGSREYAISPSQDILRIAAFGDSFVHGDDVPNADAWSIVMERTRTDIELMNFGVGGHGPDQAYLRYKKDGRVFSPQVVLLGYQTENINRVVNVFRPFYSPKTGHPLAKPFFRLIGGELQHAENPLGSVAQYQRLLDEPATILGTMAADDFHYAFRYKQGPLDWSPMVRLAKALVFELKSRYMNPLFRNGRYRTSSAAFPLLVAIINAFHCDVLADGALPVVVLFPDRSDIARLTTSDSLQYEPLKQHLLATGYPVIDLADAFRPSVQSSELDDLVLAHYTASGNSVVAEYLLAEVEKAGFFEERSRETLRAELIRGCAGRETAIEYRRPSLQYARHSPSIESWPASAVPGQGLTNEAGNGNIGAQRQR